MDHPQTGPRIGCSGLPGGLHRERYFDRLSYLECPETFANPPRLKVLRSWREAAPASAAFGLIASRLITHPAPRDGYPELDQAQWPQAGDYRDTGVVRAALSRLAEQVEALRAEIVVFRTPPGLSRSAEDRLRQFFAELATEEALGGARRAWEPGDLWETETALHLAEEMNVVPVLDPLAESPLGGSEPRPIDLLDPATPAYLRVRAIGVGRGGLREHDAEELAEELAGRAPLWLVFAGREKNRDAKRMSELLGGS